VISANAPRPYNLNLPLAVICRICAFSHGLDSFMRWIERLFEFPKKRNMIVPKKKE
jgi:hypothetical protein